jgi:threonyl-tRNA synthetase
MIRIALPDGSRRAIRPGACIQDAANEIDPQLGKSIVCVSIDGELHDVRDRLTDDCALTIYTAKTPEGRKVLCHTAAHVAAQAVKRFFPTAVLGTGSASGGGFYHDFEIGRPLSRREVTYIEAEMTRIVEEDLPIERHVMSKGDARVLLVRRGEILKLELLEEIDSPTVVLYTQGDHADLCRGPHALSTGRVPGARLTRVAAATWRDDPHAEVLTRIHGTVDRAS